MAKTLTVLQVRAIKKEGKHPVGDGLYLIVDGPARRWMFRFQIDGRRREMGLGSCVDLSLADARAKAIVLKQEIRSGIDPIEEKKGAKAAEVKIPTFGEFSDELIASIQEGFRNAKHRYQWEQTLGLSYCGDIRNKRIDEIDTKDVLSVLTPIWTTKQETASRLRGRIEKVLDAAKSKGMRSEDNPARWRGHLENLLPRRQKLQRGHQPAMAYPLVPAFVKRLGTRDAIAAYALEFLILTAARAGEVYGATWQEFDLTDRTWTIPAKRMKAGREHRVPLTSRTIEILGVVDQLRSTKTPDEYVFPGGRKGRPLSNMAFKQLLVRMGETGFVPHGFRSSFRDWCGECTDFPREVAEAALAHIVGNSVEQAYRRGDALEKRRLMMDAWQNFILQNTTE